MKKFFFLFLFSFESVVSSVAAYVPPASVEITGVTVYSNYLRYNWKKKVLYLKGNVEIKYGNILIKGDKFLLDKKNFKFSSSGEVSVIGEGFVMYGRSLTFSVYPRKIYVEDVKVLFPLEHLTIRGKSLKVEGRRIIVTDAYYSSCACEHPPPFWEIEAGKITMRLGGYSWIFSGSVRFRGIKVLWVPLLILPAKYERETGFLFPRFSYTGERGFEMHLPFYLNLSPWSEGILQLDYYSTGNIGIGGLLNYIISEKSKGRWSLKSAFGDAGNFAELRGSHFYNGSSVAWNINADMMLNPFLRAYYVDDPASRGKSFLPSSFDYQKFIDLGKFYGDITLFQDVGTGNFSFYPVIGFSSVPALTSLGDGVVWSRFDIPQSKKEVRNLTGIFWGKSFNMRYATFSIDQNSVLENFSGNYYGIWYLNYAITMMIKGSNSYFTHNSVITAGYRYLFWRKVLDVYNDGLDSFSPFKGFFVKVNDRIDTGDFILADSKKFLIGMNGKLFLSHDFLVKKDDLSLLSHQIFDGRRLADVFIDFFIHNSAGSFHVGSLLWPVNEEMYISEQPFYYPYFTESGEGQWFFSFSRRIGNWKGEVGERFLIGNKKVFEENISLQYSDPCHCFSFSFSYYNWPYRKNQKWSLWMSFGKLGEISF